MATRTLPPAVAPANHDRAAFNLALVRFADATAERDAVPLHASIERDIAAGDAVDSQRPSWRQHPPPTCPPSRPSYASSSPTSAPLRLWPNA